jgi:hypothetical protein
MEADVGEEDRLFELGPGEVTTAERLEEREMQGTQRRELSVRKQPTSRGKARPHGKGGYRRME